jgi:hypothetical protein
VVNLLLTGGVQNIVALDGIVEDTGLGNLLALEALVLLKVLSIIVTQMVVRDDGGKAEAGSNEEITHDCLEAGLARFEIIAAQE